MITNPDLKKHLTDLIEKYGKDKLMQAMSEHLKYIAENYKDLDLEAKVIADKQFGIIEEVNEEAYETMKKMPDSIETRKNIRTYLRAGGSNFEAKYLLEKLNAPSKLSQEIIKDSRDVFCETIQPALNYLCDIHQKSLSFEEMVILILSYACVDELLVSLHLAQHNYAPQSFNHTRIAMEIIDKIEFFIQKPEEIYTWWNNDPKTIRNEFRHKKIKDKIGDNKEDLVYGVLSSVGIHGDLDYLKTKLKMEFSDIKTMKVNISVGGSRVDEDLLIMTHGICITITGLLFAKIIKFFEKYLIAEEIKNDFNVMTMKSEEYLSKYFYPACKKKGIDITIMKEMLKSGSL